LLAGLRGPLFERFSHISLAAGGIFQVRELTSSKEQNATDHLTLPRSKVFRFSSLDEVTSDKSARYCQPSVSNFPSVDALMKVSFYCVDCFNGLTLPSPTAQQAFSDDCLAEPSNKLGGSTSFYHGVERETDVRKGVGVLSLLRLTS